MAIDPRMNRAPVTPTFESASVAGLENRRYNAGDFRTRRAGGWRSSTATNETKTKRKKTMNPNKTTQLKLSMLSSKIIQRTSVDIDSVVHSARQIMLAASLLLVAAGSSRAQTLQQLMPSAVAAPIGSGEDLIANPFSPSDSLLMVTGS